MASKSDLIREVLAEIGALSAGQDPSAEDSDLASTRIRYALANLTARQLLPEILWAAATTDEELIDEQYMAPLISYLSEVVAPAFGGTTSEENKLIAEGVLREQHGIGRRSQRNFRCDHHLVIMARG
jgi:hypothetical protein